MNWVFRDNSDCARERGFTLIEIAIGLIIIGLLAVPYMQTYQAWKLKTINTETANNASAIRSALAKYATRYGRYPLPANPSLASGTAGEGSEVAVGTIGTCTVASTGVCRATASWGSVGHNTVLIGTVPYATLGLPLKNTYDGYKDKFKYAVTEFMTTTPYSFSNDDGILKVVNRDGNDIDSIASPVWSNCATSEGLPCSFTGTQQVLFGVDTKDSSKYKIFTLTGPVTCSVASLGFNPSVGNSKQCWVAPLPKAHARHFVIVSHGPDRKGAFSLQGIQAVPCTAVVVPPGKDDINCQNTATFNDNNDGNGNGGRFTVAGANHYDDYILSTATLEEGNWVQKTGKTDLYSNLPANGNILISPDITYDSSGNPIAPSARLQVEGGDVKATSLVINRLCTTGGCGTPDSPTVMPTDIPANTFTPQSIAGTPDYTQVNQPGHGISCGKTAGDAGAMTGIASSDETCLNVFPSGFDMGGCAAKQVAHGTDSSGHLICSSF